MKAPTIKRHISDLLASNDRSNTSIRPRFNHITRTDIHRRCMRGAHLQLNLYSFLITDIENQVADRDGGKTLVFDRDVIGSGREKRKGEISVVVGGRRSARSRDGVDTC